MRVISGSSKGKKLFSLEGVQTRPTLDRVKEAVFNIIQFDIREANILDLFSGSGALGIEAISRGANHATFCDHSNKAVDIINKNLEATKLKNKSTVINKDYIEAINKLSKETKKFDIIFLDPPYKTDFIMKSIQYILKKNILEQNGIIIAETDDESKIEQVKKYKDIEIYDVRKYGSVLIIFIRKG